MSLEEQAGELEEARDEEFIETFNDNPNDLIVPAVIGIPIAAPSEGCN